MSSIQGKILAGYFVLTAGVSGFVFFASTNLHFLEQRVEEGVAISIFQEITQEMRRHEKNYFLYPTHSEAGGELAAARSAATDLMSSLGSRALISVTQGDELIQLKKTLTRYLSLLNEIDPPETSLRAAGHALSLRSDRLAERERISLVAAVRQSRDALLWSVGTLVLLAFAGSQVLYRMVGRPLRQLEEQLEPLVQGRFRTFAMVSKDREIVSFTQALNHMLKELDLSRGQVLRAEKLASLGTLASGVAHELNNPLSNISGAAQIALEELASLPNGGAKELVGWLKQIDDETERARRIVRILLDYSRHSSLESISTPLLDVLEKSLLLLGSQLPTKNTVSLYIPEGMRVCIEPQRMQQLFINLIQNAIQAGGEAVHIQIQAQYAEPEDWPPAEISQGTRQLLGKPSNLTKAILIYVRDDGPGISPDHIGQIFDPFFTTREPGDGTGLGLYLVAEIVQDYGGAIAATSTTTGSTFILWLPVADPQ